MSCATSDIELNRTRTELLTVINDTSLTIDEIANKTTLPLFAIRSNLRYLTEIEYITLKEGKYKITSKAIDSI